jgi:AAA ATPase
MFNALKNIFKGGGYIEGFNLKRYKEKKNYLSNVLPYECALNDGVILLKHGAVMKCYSFTCPDLGSSSEASINSVAMYFNRAIKLLGSSWAIQFEVQRVMTNNYPETEWMNEAGFIVDKCREKNFKRVGEHFVSKFYLTFSKELDIELKDKAQGFFIKKDTEEKANLIDTAGVRKQIEDFIVMCEKTVGS